MVVEGVGFVGWSWHCAKGRAETSLCRVRMGTGKENEADALTARHIRNFLTQRSLQTLLFYLSQTRDQPSFRFLHSFEGHDGIFEYHGFNGLRLPWEEYMKKLLLEPNKVITLRNPNYRRGGTKGNPYIQRHEDFDYTIEPKQLGRRLLNIRVHLSEEFIEDLGLVKEENEDLRRRQQQMVRADSDEDFQELLAPKYPTKEREIVFHANSPYREGTYDLLNKYSVYCAVKRSLEVMDRTYSQRDNYRWLQNFLETEGTKFDGDHGYNVGEEFIFKLWQQLPLLRKTRAGGMKVIDPDSMVETIMQERLQVADVWIRTLQGSAEDNLPLQKYLLEDLIKET